MARKSGKSFRLDALFRLLQKHPSLMHFSGCSKRHAGFLARQIITTRIAGGLLLGYNPKYTCPGLKSFALHFVQVTIAM